MEQPCTDNNGEVNSFKPYPSQCLPSRTKTQDIIYYLLPSHPCSEAITSRTNKNRPSLLRTQGIPHIVPFPAPAQLPPPPRSVRSPYPKKENLTSPVSHQYSGVEKLQLEVMRCEVLMQIGSIRALLGSGTGAAPQGNRQEQPELFNSTRVRTGITGCRTHVG